MPYVNVRVAGELSDDQKDEIVSQITDTLREVAGKPDESTYVVIDEVPRHNWAKGGLPDLVVPSLIREQILTVVDPLERKKSLK